MGGARGIQVPMQAVNGRLKMIGGEEYVEQLVLAAIGTPYSENPFQDVGLSEFMIFDVNDELVEGEIRSRIKERFQSLEDDQLARLESLKFETDGAEKRALLVYTNLETGNRRELEVPTPGSSY